MKYSLIQKRNNFEILDIGSQQKDTRNREKHLELCCKKLCTDFRAISLINASRKLGVIPSDLEVNEMIVEQLRNFKHKIADLYIFGNGELVGFF